MITSLRLAANGVGGFGPFGHLQFVGVSGSSLYEIEVQPGDDGLWSVEGIDVDRDHIANTPGYGSSFTYGSVDLELGDRDANDVWTLLHQIGEDIQSVGLDYDVFFQNSNTFVYSTLLAIGTSAPFPSSLIINALWDVRDRITFTISGTEGVDWFYSGAKNDVIVGGDGADILNGGGGSDIIIVGKIDGVNQALDENTEPPKEKIDGGADIDYLVLTGGKGAVVTLDAADPDAKIDQLFVHAKAAGVEGTGDYKLLKLIGGVFVHQTVFIDGVHVDQDANYIMNITYDDAGNQWKQYNQIIKTYNDPETGQFTINSAANYSYSPALHRLEISITDQEDFF